MAPRREGEDGGAAVRARHDRRVLSLVFSVIYLSRNTGHTFWVYWASLRMTIGAFLIRIPVPGTSATE